MTAGALATHDADGVTDLDVTLAPFVLADRGYRPDTVALKRRDLGLDVRYGEGQGRALRPHMALRRVEGFQSFAQEEQRRAAARTLGRTARRPAGWSVIRSGHCRREAPAAAP